MSGISSKLTRGRRRVMAIGATVAAFSALSVSPAFANWTSYIDEWRIWQESRRWADESYTELQFTGCDSNFDYGAHVEIYRVVNNWPDDGYGRKEFTACFKGSTSKGTESGLPKADYYFRLQCIDYECDKQNNNLDVKKVYVDTTLAD